MSVTDNDRLTAIGAVSRAAVTPPGQGYSRLVSFLKLLLPAIAAALLLLIVAWPHLQATLDKVGTLVPRLNLSDARDLRMLNARVSGVDRQNRPYVVTADTARQLPGADGLIAMEGPKADMTLQSGVWLAVTADTGVYKSQSQLLDLFGQVNLFHDKGYEFVTDSAHVDMQAGTAEGDEKVRGQGIFGHVDAEGFRIYDQGDRVVFTGKSKMLLLPNGGSSRTTTGPAPAPGEAAAR
jgi:lipopolysaccharide export system protein LptC